MSKDGIVKTDLRQDYEQYIFNDKFLNCQKCRNQRSFLEYGDSGFIDFIAEDYKEARLVIAVLCKIETKFHYVFSYKGDFPKESVQEKFNWFHSIMRYKAILKVMLKGYTIEEVRELANKANLVLFRSEWDKDNFWIWMAKPKRENWAK